ncbi:MAG: STAS domain-containing protein [Actinomycetota bacterium]
MSRSTIGALWQGVVSGVLVVLVVGAIAAMLFSEPPLPDFVASGTAMLLAGTLAATLLIGAFSAFTPAIGRVQETPGAVLAFVATATASAMAGEPDDTVFATVVAVVTMTTAATAAIIYLMGRFGLGRLARFIPYQVGGGFLAGTGWLIAVGGLAVSADEGLDRQLLDGSALDRAGPAVVLGIVMLLVARRQPTIAVFVALSLCAAAAVHVWHIVFGDGFSGARDERWLLGPYPDGPLVDAGAITMLPEANWTVIGDHWPWVVSAILITLVAIQLSIAQLELDRGDDVDIDRELRTAGTGNAVAAFTASAPVFLASTPTSLVGQTRDHARLPVVGVAAVVVLTIAVGADVLAAIPRAVAGGLLIYFGLSMAVVWLWDKRNTMPRADYALIWLIALSIGVLGVVEGIAVGVLAAAVRFVADYSRRSVVRREATRSDVATSTMRASLEEQLLEDRGDRIAVVTLQGHMFFGTAHRLALRIRQRLAERPTMRYLVLDMRFVTGIDASATATLERLRQHTDEAGVTVLVAGLDPTIANRVEARMTLARDDSTRTPNWRVERDVDSALRWAEEQVLDEFTSAGLSARSSSTLDAAERALTRSAPETDWLDQLGPMATPKMSAGQRALHDAVTTDGFERGDVLVEQGQSVGWLIVIRSGDVVAEDRGPAGELLTREVVDVGAEPMAAAFWSGEPATRRLVATSAGSWSRLSAAAVEALERDHPDVAVAVLRAAARRMANESGRMHDTARNLQR